MNTKTEKIIEKPPETPSEKPINIRSISAGAYQLHVPFIYTIFLYFLGFY